ncbi:hypothetical protein NBO_43g0004 [Nosema bombycis CQ1]|uniref:Uncharacterized protein n=1 Tax=Nosema bombycis (strain CQ1 / CVCC 102059) TaxID=578461 RepID=R0M7N5_NOSB1|nr:hypothetical protein NBO_43g0004 [Nosema bombycis CQ1]|eukprot:EOB13999.1 hypothetical protein NBO_43g0004 [Nosema bombycis CQ1]
MDESLLKYKKTCLPYNHSTLKEYLDEQMSNNPQDKDLMSIKKQFDSSKFTPDLAVSKLNKCRITSVLFYSNYLFYNFKIEGIKALVFRFNRETAEENKIVIYNCLKLLLTNLELIDVLKLLDQSVLSILVGEYGKGKGLPIEDLGLLNFHLKFLGYFTKYEIESMSIAELKMYLEKDVNVMKIFTMCTANHFKLKNMLVKDFYLKFYIENCTVDMNLLKNLKSDYNPYTLYLLFNKLRDDKTHCETRINELLPKYKTSLFILFARDDEWLDNYATEELPSINLQLKDEIAILNLINQTEKGFIYFEGVKELIQFAPIGKVEDLKVIDSILFERSMTKILEKCLYEGMSVNIWNWLSSKEVYFSLIVENYPWLREFHESSLNQRNRTEMAEDILYSNKRYLFLNYINERSVIVDFREIGEIVNDFSVEWLKMFIEENYKRIKQIKGDKYTSSLIVYLAKDSDEDDRDILLIVNDKNHLILEKVLSDLSKNFNLTKKGNITKKSKRIRKSRIIYPEEEYLIKAYENASSRNNFLNLKNITNFKRPGDLNKFILSHLHDLERCARIVANVVRDSHEIENFLRKIFFVIEDENLLSTFIYHFLRFSGSNVSFTSIEKWADTIGPILLAAKVDADDLDTLIDNYYSEDLKKGILLRGYSYLFWDPKSTKKFNKMVDGDITFYYEISLADGVKIKYQLETIKYDFFRGKEFFKKMATFANSNCPLRKEVVLRCINVLGFDFEHKKNKEKEQNLIKLLIKNPFGNIHLLHKLVKIDYKLKLKTVYQLIDSLIEIRGEKEKAILEVIKLFPRDKELIDYILSNFEYFSNDTKLQMIEICKYLMDQEIFEKYCEVIKNEENLDIIKVLLKDLKERKVYFPIIEEWKSNPKLKNLLIKIYPLGMKDKEFYVELFKKCNVEEKKMIKEVFKIKM